jgi:hypothetical protein
MDEPLRVGGGDPMIGVSCRRRPVDDRLLILGRVRGPSRARNCGRCSQEGIGCRT